MPSFILHDQVPHFVFFPTQPLFCLPLLVFGYVCFVHILTPGEDKVSAKPTKSVFLSYSHLHRGYLCYAILLLLVDMSSPLMSHSLGNSLCFLQLSSLPFLTPFPFLWSCHLWIHRLHLRLLNFPFNHCRFNSHRPLLHTKPHVDSSPMAPSSKAPIISPSQDLLIALMKSTHSSRNHHLIYTFLTYHCLFAHYFAFVSTWHYIPLLKTKHEIFSLRMEIDNN